MHVPRRCRPQLAGPVAGLLVTLCAACLQGGELRTAERTLHTYAFGDRTFVCLVLDGGQFPLASPPDARFTGTGNGLTLVWPKSTAARFRGATAAEAALVPTAEPAPGVPAPPTAVTPAEADRWVRAAAAGLAPGIEARPGPRGALDNVLPVNGWRAGAVDLEYALGGQRFGRLFLVCRSRQGDSFSATLDAPAAEFDAHRDEVLRLLSGAVWMAP